MDVATDCPDEQMKMTSTVAYLGFGKGGHGERAKREPITGSGGGSPAGSRDRAPGRGVGLGGRSPPWSWNTFCFWMFNRNRKFAHFSEIWKRKRPSNIVEFCNSCWKMAKNASFHIKSPVINFHGRTKGGHSTVPPKYATGRAHRTVPKLLTTWLFYSCSIQQFWLALLSFTINNYFADDDRSEL